MNDEENREVVEVEATPPSAKVKVIRTSVHKKMIAPPGCIWIVATCTDGKNQIKYTMWKLIYTKGLTEESELKLKLELAASLTEKYQL